MAGCPSSRARAVFPPVEVILRVRLNPTSLVASLVVVCGITLCSNALGYLRQVLIAGFFGANGTTDAFFAASIVAVISLQLFGSSLGAVFVPVFTQLREERGSEAAWRYATNLVNVVGGVSFVLCIGVYLLSPRVVVLLAPGFDSAQKGLAADLLASMCPLIFLYSVNGLLAGVANAHRRFAASELTGLVSAALNAVVLLALVRFLGIYAAVAGSLVSAACQFVLLLWYDQRLGLRMRVLVDLREPGLHRSLRLSAAVFVGTLLGFAAPVIDRVLSSFMAAGSLSSLDYAERIIMLFSAVVITPLGTILLTSFSEIAGRKEFAQLGSLFRRVLATMSFVAFPCAVLLSMLAEPVVILFFRHGAFDQAAVAKTASAVQFYAFWLPFLAINTVAGRFFYSVQRVMVPIAVGVIALLINAGLKLALSVHMQQGGLALATALSSACKAAILLFMITRIAPEFALRSTAGSLCRTVLLSTVAGALACAMYRLVFAGGFAAMGIVAQAGAVAASALAGVALYLFASRLSGSEELGDLLGMLRRLGPRGLVADGPLQTPAE
jgi:putative peptidoglycan lipid II flippase